MVMVLISDMLDKSIACQDEQQQDRLQGDRRIQPIAAIVDAYLPTPLASLQAKMHDGQYIEEDGQHQAADDHLCLVKSKEINRRLKEGGREVIIHGLCTKADAGQHGQHKEAGGQQQGDAEEAGSQRSN